MNTTHPRITMVTPSYNQAAFLEATICSVLDQNYPNLQYGIVDGNSDDGSAAIIEKYRERVDFAIVESDRGQVDAINKGLIRADGDIIGFINSDDTLLPGCLDAVSQHFINNPDSQWVVGDCVVIDADGMPMEVVDSTAVRELSHALIREKRFNIPQPSVFWRRSLLDRFGLFLEKYEYSFDFEMWCRFLNHGVTLDKMDVSLGTYRMHETSKTCSLRDRMTADRIAIERDYAPCLAFKDRLQLMKLLGYRERELTLACTEGRPWKQVLRRPWWLLSSQVREALTVRSAA